MRRRILFLSNFEKSLIIFFSFPEEKKELPQSFQSIKIGGDCPIKIFSIKCFTTYFSF
jgi:hypothetical protein